MNNDTLARFYSPETIQKLELLAQATSHQWKTGFEKQLNLLRFFASVLIAVDQVASVTPLANVEDAGIFALELDHAGEAILAEMAQFVNNPAQPIEPQLPHLADRFLAYFEGLPDVLSEDYLRRRARIIARGKTRLLARIMAKAGQQIA